MPAARCAVEWRRGGRIYRARHGAARRRAHDRAGRAGGADRRRARTDLPGALRRRAYPAALRFSFGESPHAGAGGRRLFAHPQRPRFKRDAARLAGERDGGKRAVRTGGGRVWRRPWPPRGPRPALAGARAAAAENPPSRRCARRCMMQATALLHLLQFASPALPIGAYSYSQGLEAALESGEVHNADTARVWIVRHLHEVVAQWEAPITWRLMQAWSKRDWRAVSDWSEKFIASRDSSEFRAETIQMGYSLVKLVAELGIADADTLAHLQSEPEVALPTAFSCAVAALSIPHDAALLAMLFAWAENQVL